MKILNFGSINMDKVYSVEHFVNAGETILSKGLTFHSGGKGLNQSIAIARAGSQVVHFGAVGQDGDMLIEVLEQEGVDVTMVKQLDGESGHAIIQVEENGQNCIIVHGGSNQKITPKDVDEVMEEFGEGDIFLCQNETSEVLYAIRKANQKGMRVIVNPSPINEVCLELKTEDVECFVLNETEAKELTGCGSENEEELLQAMRRKYPSTVIVLTVGEKGVIMDADGEVLHHDIYRVPVVDTTAAGDTFCGYYISGIAKGKKYSEILEEASKASAIAVSRAGAAPSIPLRKEVENFCK